MGKSLVFVVLFISYMVYGWTVYTKGTTNAVSLSPAEASLVDRGKMIYQEKNCSACHQLYGLGGYLGPELTTAWSDRSRGENYMRAFLKTGSRRMPDFHFTEPEIVSLLHYFRYIDSTATTYKTPKK